MLIKKYFVLQGIVADWWITGYGPITPSVYPIIYCMEIITIFKILHYIQEKSNVYCGVL